MRKVRHKKRGTMYEVIGTARMQAEGWSRVVYRETDGHHWETNHPVDRSEVVVYRSVTDPTEIWVRPVDEFNDGRFEDCDPD